jgi:transcriptional regulator with XRE-family HTH domain
MKASTEKHGSDTENTQGEFLITLGQRIRGTRIKRGMTQTDLAGAARLDRAYLSGVENGKHNITVGAILRLANALEIAPEVLIAFAPRGQEEGGQGAPRRSA